MWTGFPASRQPFDYPLNGPQHSSMQNPSLVLVGRLEFTSVPSTRHWPRQSRAHHLPLLPVLPGSLSTILFLCSLPFLCHGVGLVLCLSRTLIYPPNLQICRLLVPASPKQAFQMDSELLAGDLPELQAAVPIDERLPHGMIDFMMGGPKRDEAAPTDAGDEDGDDDDGDEDGDFAEGEEDISEGEEYDNLKASDTKKKQVGEGEENGEEDDEEPEEQEGGGGDDDDDDDDDDNEDDDDEEDAGEDDEDGVEEEDDDDQDDEEEDDDEDSLQPPKKRKK
ncbi:pheromone-processing carboxypeptidase KEX1-like [Lolium rigidum]|nr:pheromone-processing carboxypeptidase KEX1-like [Lolium rigidum]